MTFRLPQSLQKDNAKYLHVQKNRQETQVGRKKQEKDQPEEPEEGLLLHFQILKDHATFYRNFSELSIREMDRIIKLLVDYRNNKKAARSLKTTLSLEVQIEILTDIRKEQDNILRKLKQIASFALEFLPSIGKKPQKQLKNGVMQHQKMASSINIGLNPDFEEKQRLK